MPALEVDTGVQCDDTADVTDDRGNAAESGAVYVCARVAPLCSVENVNGIGANREGFTFCELNRLGDRRIEAEQSGSPDADRVERHVADAAGSRVLENRVAGSIHCHLVCVHALQRGIIGCEGR